MMRYVYLQLITGMGGIKFNEPIELLTFRMFPNYKGKRRCMIAGTPKGLQAIWPGAI